MSHTGDLSFAAIFSEFRPDHGSPHSLTVQKAVHLARFLQRRANDLQTPQERRQQAELDRMIHNPADKATLTQMTDQAFRSRTPHRAVDQLVHILDVQGVPRFFGPWDRTLLKGFQTFGGYLPGVAVPFVKQRMHRETANVVLPAERDMLCEHLRARWEEGVRMNVNYLGEAILGEEEAQNRLERYLEALQMPEIEVVSVKISTIYSQISPLARRNTIAALCDRLELLFRAAAKARFRHADGREVPKLVYLDMEEYRDTSLTTQAFMRTLDQHGLEDASAGIVLQAYLPDAYRVQTEIHSWARDRLAAGRAPITLRIVKGANMEMERVDASLHGWPQAPYKTKLETDANYKRMLHEAMRPENLSAVRLGVASHNLFELAYGLVLAIEAGALDRVQFEMLEGMANHQRRALFQLARNVLLYAPACQKEDFIHAIGYLIRRLDENTGPENFLRHAFKLEVGSEEWRLLEEGFLRSFEQIATLTDTPRRTQDRRLEGARREGVSCEQLPSERAPTQAGSAAATRRIAKPGDPSFFNEPDTDFSLPQNVEWAEQILADWLPRTGENAMDVPLVIAGNEVTNHRTVRESTDPSRPGVVVARFCDATREDIDVAVACAKRDECGWRWSKASDRREILRRAADEIRTARADLMGIAMVEGGKTLAESDPEVSEAVDFVEFYSQSADRLRDLPGLAARGRGVVVVVSPWNFPIAIPCGGIAAALAAGNTVILKPASDTVATAHVLCGCFWSAGVPSEVLQFVPCPGQEAGSHLVAHHDVDVVILTGGTETALRMLDAKPTMTLLAETGGKNATVVTALADRDQAIKHVIHSAFSHAGQKCSATSLLILEEEVYHDEDFRKALCDAVRSIPVGPAHQLATRMGPLIRPPSGHLERGLKELEPHESWAVMPRHLGDNPNLYSPGVKFGVLPGSYTHTTEFFGPVLGVMEAKNLDVAIELVNTTGYGLTSGLESLDDREQQLWQQSIRAGNLYINRGTTGAIVLRQPFGGMAKSAFGPGIKAGGPNYVAQLMSFEEVGDPDGEEIRDPEVADLLRRLQERSGPWAAGSGEGRGQWEGGARDVGERGEVAATDPAARPGADLPPADSSGRGCPGRGDSTGPHGGQGDLWAVRAAARSYARYYREEFGRDHDQFRLIGQDNIRRYVPVREVRVRVHRDDSLFEIVARVIAAKTAGCRVTVSYPPGSRPGFPSTGGAGAGGDSGLEASRRNDRTPGVTAIELLDELTDSWAAAIEFVEETDEELAERIRERQTDRLRYAAPGRVPRVVREAAPAVQLHIADSTVLRHGRIELLWYFQEQSLCVDYHRYGNLGERAVEERSATL